MFDIHLPTLLLAAFPGLVLQVLVHRLWLRRVRGLERDLQELSDVVCRMAEVESRAFKKLSGNINDFEERLMDLSVPSGNPTLPLERRHQVLALARKGASAEEITKKLNIPRGEADLILSLRSYMEGATPLAAHENGDMKRHAKI